MPFQVNPILTAEHTSSTPSLFRGHLLTRKHEKPQLHFTNYEYGVASILFLSFILYVWLYVFNRKRLLQVIKGFYINRYANQLAREEFSVTSRGSFFLSFLFIISLTLFIDQAGGFYGIIRDENDFLLFSMITLAVVLIYAVKLIVIKLSGFIFQTRKEANDYTMTVFLFTNALGLFLLPVVVCLAFVRQISPQIFIYSGFGLIAGFVFTRIIRGLVIGFNSNRVSKFYLFLYLCTLEILPSVIAVKVFLLNTK